MANQQFIRSELCFETKNLLNKIKRNNGQEGRQYNMLFRKNNLDKKNINEMNSHQLIKQNKVLLSKANINSLVSSYKQLFGMNIQSQSKVQSIETEKLSLFQYKCLEKIHEATKRSLHSLYRAYNANPQSTAVDTGISQQKVNLFRAGVYYRSKNRAAGTGVRPFNPKDTEQYLCRKEEEECISKLNKSPFQSSFGHSRTSFISRSGLMRTSRPRTTGYSK